MDLVARILPVLARARVGLTLTLFLALGCQLVFAFNDGRPPNDHDDFYTASSAWAVVALDQSEAGGAPQVLSQHLRSGDLHPRLTPVLLVAAMDLFGPSLSVFRALLAPFFALLIVGSWLLAREVLRPRSALLATFVVATLPIVTNYSRKWDTQFFAAAATPLGLYLALRCLRSPTPRLLLALGLWQGLRLYFHPVVLPDIALTGLIFFGLLFRQARSSAAPRDALRRLGLLPIGFLISGAYYLGLTPESPKYSLLNYIQRRSNYSSLDFLSEANLASHFALFYRQVSEFIWLHLMPGFALLLIPGLIIALPALRRGANPDGAPPHSARAARIIALILTAQVPVILIAVSNHAFFNDWLFLAPSFVVLAFYGLSMGQRSFPDFAAKWTERWVLALMVVGTAQTIVPLVASALGPDPLDEPEYYDDGPLRLFTRSTSGRHFTTHHLLSHREQPQDRLAQAMSKSAASGEPMTGVPLYGLLDLTWAPSELGTASTFAWELPEPNSNAGHREPSPWPFVFAGLPGARSYRPDHERDPGFTDWDTQATEWSGQSWAQSPLAPEDGQPIPEWSIVRLWIHPEAECIASVPRCSSFGPIPVDLVEQAAAAVQERFAGVTSIQALPDPAATLRGQTVEWDPHPLYLGTVLLLQHP